MVSDEKTARLTRVINKLQSVPYQINTKLLCHLVKCKDIYHASGLLMPSILASIDRTEGTVRLKHHYLNDKEMKKYFSLKDLINIWIKNIQSACYEQYILKLADALQNYNLYFPTFLDFRGRNYRYGPFHYHERDLVRSLILFAQSGVTDTPPDKGSQGIRTFMASTAFHYSKYWKNYNEGIIWFIKNIHECSDLNSNKADIVLDRLANLARKARHPFQFLSSVITLKNRDSDKIARTPIHLDASASAYQMLSYLLGNITMARNTNLISENNKINNIYEIIDSDFKKYIERKYGEHIITRYVCSLFDRDIIKNIFMPIVYGKSKFSTAIDLLGKIGSYMVVEDLKTIIKECYNFWESEYKDMRNLMHLVASISWVSSFINKPVIYSTEYWITVQDYIIMEPVKITVKYQTHGMVLILK